MIADCSCVFFAKHQTPGDMAHGRELAAKNTKRIPGTKALQSKLTMIPIIVESSCAWQCNNFQT